jgi:recombination protein RecA
LDNEVFQKLLEATREDLKDRKVLANIHKPTDIGIASYIPYTISSGLAELDLQLGGKGGIPAGRLIEYYGFESVGKTTAALHALAEVQKMGGFGLFIDAENTWSPTRAQQCKVDLNKLQVASVNSVEALFETACVFIDKMEELGLAKKYPCLIAADSLTGTHVESEFESRDDGEYSRDQRIGSEAKAIRRGVKKLQGKLARAKVACILINHAIATNLTAAYGKKSGSAGGHGAKLLSTIRIEFKNAGRIGTKDQREGQEVQITIEKLKNAQLTEIEIGKVELREHGFDQNLSLLRAGVRTGWLTEQGAGRGLTYSLKLGEEVKQFKQKGWADIVEQLGGYDEAYKLWIEKAKLDNYIRPWEDAW